MSMYMDVTDMLDDYGVDIKVWPASKPHTGKKKLVGGFAMSDDKLPASIESQPQTRHEPVLPMSSNNSILAEIFAGGFDLSGDLLWLSSGQFNEGTRVYVASQGGYYKVTGHSSYQDYSNLTVYELKGDDQHQDD